MKERLRAGIKDYRFWTVAVCFIMAAVLLIINFKNATIPTPTNCGAASCAFIYLVTALPFVISCAVAGFKLKRSKTLLIACGLFALSYILRMLFADDESPDYGTYLSQWMLAYRGMSIKDCFIEQVGNYSPLYNYFLIAFSRMSLWELYLIKTVSFYCEFICAIFAVKIVALVRGEKFNFTLLGAFLLVPVFLMNGSQWAQCDAQYTMCAVIAVYFALRSKSVPCFIFIGLGLAFKMQTVLILPAGLIILLAKKPDGGKYLLWRYIWIVPLVFLLVSSLPVCFGGSFFKVFKVYFDQATNGNADRGQALNGHCANILLPFSVIKKGTVAYYILLVLFILITAVIEIFIIVHTLKRTNRILDAEKIVFLCVAVPFFAVFFMPKMLDRFFYIAEVFSAVYLLIKREKAPFTWFVLLETAQIIMYMRALCGINGLFVITPLFSGFALLLVAARFFKYFPCNKPKFLHVWVDAIEYGKVIKPESNETPPSEEFANESVTDLPPKQQSEE